MVFGKQGIGHVAPVQLPHREQVEGRDQQTDPAGKGHWMQDDILLRRHRPQGQPAQKLEQQGLPQGESLLIPADDRDRGQFQANEDDRDGNHDAG